MPINHSYIKGVSVENYKSLKGSKIEFQKGLNIIIGKNGAGKSNLLEFIYRFCSRNLFHIARFPRTINNFETIYECNTEENAIIQFSFKIERLKKQEISLFPTDTNHYKIKVYQTSNSKRKFLGSYDIPKNIRDNKELQNIADLFTHFRRTHVSFKYPDNLFWIDKTSRLTTDSENTRIFFDDSDYELGFISELEWMIESKLTLNANEDNFALLKDSFIKQVSAFIAKMGINKILKKYSPINELRLNPNVNIYKKENLTIIENLSFDFLVDKDWIPWSYLSDGTKRIFYLLSESYSLKEGILFVEEPELGIHPQQLYRIMDFLKQESQSKQVIISTHSPIVLDILNNDELDRINIAKYSGNKTKFTKLTPTQIEKAKKYMENVGELSYYWLHSDLEK